MSKARTELRIIGHVGVDAGMIYLGDPCYIVGQKLGASWDDFVRDHIDFEKRDQFYQIPAKHDARAVDDPDRACLAVVVGTGYGDGIYPVMATIDEEGHVHSVTIKFD